VGRHFHRTEAVVISAWSLVEQYPRSKRHNLHQSQTTRQANLCFHNARNTSKPKSLSAHKIMCDAIEEGGSFL
jgi:hypothetical protein